MLKTRSSRIGRPTVPLAVRFWRFVNKTPTCWLWTGGTCKGYGAIMGEDQKQLVASRVSWELHFGSIPDGMLVCHNCPGGDNPLCVNPEHLWLGTPSQNTSDAVAKGLMSRGALNWAAILTEEDVLRIRAAFRNERAKRDRPSLRIREELAAAYGVAENTIQGVVYNRHWKHLVGDGNW